jgi:formylglycine-generating enzyme required for sulfatase activity
MIQDVPPVVVWHLRRLRSLHDTIAASMMIGNVWEWTRDWYSPRHEADAPNACCIPENPRGGREDASYDPGQPQITIPRKVLTKAAAWFGRFHFQLKRSRIGFAFVPGFALSCRSSNARK